MMFCCRLPDGRVDRSQDRWPESEAPRYGASHLEGEEALLHQNICGQDGEVWDNLLPFGFLPVSNIGTAFSGIFFWNEFTLWNMIFVAVPFDRCKSHRSIGWRSRPSPHHLSFIVTHTPRLTHSIITDWLSCNAQIYILLNAFHDTFLLA